MRWYFSNRPNSLDPSAVRRHDEWLEVPPPKLNERKDFIKSFLQPCVLTEDQLKTLSQNCQGSTFFEIKMMIKEIIESLPY